MEPVVLEVAIVEVSIVHSQYSLHFIGMTEDAFESAVWRFLDSLPVSMAIVEAAAIRVVAVGRTEDPLPIRIPVSHLPLEVGAL